MGALPGLFDPTPFTRRAVLKTSAFIRPMHPKTEVRPDPSTIRRILESGWVGQLKIHGHRSQIHVPASRSDDVIVYTRQGGLHKKLLTPEMLSEIRRLYTPQKGWNVIDAEWLKPEDKLFVFDLVKKDGELLSRLPYPERWKLLPRAFISPRISTLPLLETLRDCLSAFESHDPHVEGLVFKSRTTPGFEDTSIVRCRRKG